MGRINTPALAAVLGLTLSGIAVGASADTGVKGKPTVLVRDFTVGKKVKTDGGVLGGSFCVELAKDQRLDVICQADVAQLLEFQAQRALQGMANSAANPILARMAGARYLVDGRVVQGKYGLILEVTLSENANPGDTENGPQSGKALGTLKQKGIKGGVSGVIDRFPALAKRSAALFSPTGGADTPPPAPLKDK